VPLARTIPEKEVVDSEMSRSRFHLGPIRLLPSINVWNTGYDSNVYATNDPVAAWTLSVNAGATFLIPFGSKIVLRADAFPQYTWYSGIAGRNQLGGQYSGSLYGFFNRMTAEVFGSYFQQYQRYSTEVDSLVFETSSNALVKFDLQLTSKLGLFGQGAWADVHYRQIDGPPDQEIGVVRNSRVDTGGRGGLRYMPAEHWSVGLAAEGTFADFDFDPDLRNNTSTAVLGSVEYSRPKLFFNLLGGWREGDGTQSNYFPRYSTGVGSFFLSYFPIRWLELQVGGHRQVTYSITATNPYFFENRIGGRVHIQVAPRILLSGFVEGGPNNYPRAQPVADSDQLVKRRDESKGYGGGFSTLLWKPIVLSARIFHRKVDSNIPEFNRDYTRYMIFISFSGTFMR